MRSRYTMSWHIGTVCWYLLSSSMLYGGLETPGKLARQLVNTENTKLVLDGIKTVLGCREGDASLTYEMPPKDVSDVVKLAFDLYTNGYNKIENEYTWERLFGDDAIDDAGDLAYLVLYKDFLEKYKSYCLSYSLSETCLRTSGLIFNKTVITISLHLPLMLSSNNVTSSAGNSNLHSPIRYLNAS